MLGEGPINKRPEIECRVVFAYNASNAAPGGRVANKRRGRREEAGSYVASGARVDGAQHRQHQAVRAGMSGVLGAGARPWVRVADATQTYVSPNAFGEARWERGEAEAGRGGRGRWPPALPRQFSLGKCICLQTDCPTRHKPCRRRRRPGPVRHTTTSRGPPRPRAHRLEFQWFHDNIRVPQMKIFRIELPQQPRGPSTGSSRAQGPQGQPAGPAGGSAYTFLCTSHCVSGGQYADVTKLSPARARLASPQQHKRRRPFTLSHRLAHRNAARRHSARECPADVLMTPFPLCSN